MSESRYREKASHALALRFRLGREVKMRGGRDGRRAAGSDDSRNRDRYDPAVRTVFFGTPAIAVPALTALHETSELVGVVCQPDRPSGRGLESRPGPVKQRALELGVEVLQPTRLKDGVLRDWLAARQIDLAVVFAYGRILPVPLLEAPRLGCVNLHASLLPKYRGAAPIQWAIMRGETETGIALMRMEEGLDTGPIYAVRSLEISEQMTAGELAEQLSELGAVVVREELPCIEAGATPMPQDASAATWAPPITARDCILDWDRPARELVNQVRGLSPRPGASTQLGDRRLRVLRAARFEQVPPSDTPPGTLLSLDGDRIVVATRGSSLQLLEAQFEGRRALAARDLINGRAFRVGDVLGSPGAAG